MKRTAVLEAEELLGPPYAVWAAARPETRESIVVLWGRDDCVIMSA